MPVEVDSPELGAWIQTGAGFAFSLTCPNWRKVNFEIDIAGALSSIARWSGHTAGGPYSVAQHSVIGADTILGETGDWMAAAYFLLHDAHEAYLGDITTPVARAIANPVALSQIKSNLDRSIHIAAGLDWPAPPSTAARVHEMDARMLEAERRRLFTICEIPWSALDKEDQAAPKIHGRWDTSWAKWEFVERLNRWLPNRVSAAPFYPFSDAEGRAR